jgi:8-oxo-dGTP diphosphatase
MSNTPSSQVNSQLHEVIITAIVQKDGKMLILQRSATKRRFPGRWTVPGGHLETSDYINQPKDTAEYWYNVLEKALAREVKEEVGLDIKHVRYVTSLATIHEDGAPSLVISCLADWAGGQVKLQPEECQAFAWVDLAGAKNYDLIDGIYDELAMASQVAQGKTLDWKRTK